MAVYVFSWPVRIRRLLTRAFYRVLLYFGAHPANFERLTAKPSIKEGEESFSPPHAPLTFQNASLVHQRDQTEATTR
jgi:hypothetical protein